MRKLVLAAAIAVLLPTAYAAEMTEEQKVLYALGASVGQQLSNSFNLTPAEVELVKKGLGDAVGGGKLEVDGASYAPKIAQLAQARAGARAEKAKLAGQEFAAKVAKESGAVTTPSGLVYLSLKEGNGDSPVETDKVKVHYRGTFIDGKEFDSSYKRNEPTEFQLNGVIKCWTEGLQKMKVGGKAKLTCPASIAYGDRNSGPIPAGSTLSFDVELISVTKTPAKEAVAPAVKK